MKNTTNASILVVEDDGLIALRIRELLSHAGFRVSDPVATGEEALRRVSSTRPDLILMDIGLPGDLDGIETARRIREKCDTPIVFLTAYADDRRIGLARDISPFGFIVKPFRDTKLIECLEGALLRSRMGNTPVT